MLADNQPYKGQWLELLRFCISSFLAVNESRDSPYSLLTASVMYIQLNVQCRSVIVTIVTIPMNDILFSE